MIVDDAGQVHKLRDMHPQSEAMQTAQAYIVCVTDRNPAAVYEGHQFQVEDCAAATENMLLAITASGYATVWIDGWLRLEGRAVAIADMLQIPQDKRVRIILPLGVPAQPGQQREKLPFAQRAWFNRYGG